MKCATSLLFLAFMAQTVSAETLWQQELNNKGIGLIVEKQPFPSLFPLPADGDVFMNSGLFPKLPEFIIVSKPRVSRVFVPQPPVVTPASSPPTAGQPMPVVPLPGAFGLLASAIAVLVARGAVPSLRRRLSE